MSTSGGDAKVKTRLREAWWLPAALRVAGFAYDLRLVSWERAYAVSSWLYVRGTSVEIIERVPPPSCNH